MTYREKLQMEHPECVDECYYGGCSGCPNNHGYGPEESGNEMCLGYSKENCAKCWDTVIPGTEGYDDYKNLSRDELITLVKLLEGRIEIKDKAIANYIAACEKKNTRIKELENRLDNKDSIIAANNSVVKDLEQKIQKLEGACSAKNAEIVRLDRELRDTKQLVTWYRLNSNTVFGSLSPCNCSGCDKKNKEIEALKQSLKFEREHKNYWYNECHRLSKKICEFENSNQELKDALAEEKKEHAKHHGFFGLFYN